MQIWPAFLRKGIQIKESLSAALPAKRNRLKDRRVSVTRESADPIELAVRGEASMGSLTQFSRSLQTVAFLAFLICSMRRADPDPRQLHTYVLSMFKPLQAWRTISKAVYGVINTHAHTLTV